METSRRPNFRESQDPVSRKTELARIPEITSAHLATEGQERIQKWQHVMEELIDKYRVVEASLIRSQQGERKAVVAEAQRQSEKRANEEVLKNVIGAAERNAPIEIMYEMQHETKDVPSDPHQSSGGAVPISRVVNDIAQQNSAKFRDIKPSDPVKLSKHVVLSSPVYVASMVSGFVIGLMLLLIVLIIATR